MEALSAAVCSNLLDSLGGISPPSTPMPAPPPSTKTGVTSSTEERALALLGSGIASETVASALGVTPSRIAQLLSDETFSGKVSELRYTHLQKHNIRDGEYDNIEDTLLQKLKDSIPLMFKPELILKAVSVVNGAKRKGQATPDQIINQQNIVNLILPQVIAQKFSINIDNQVIRAGDQELLTMPSGNLLKQVEQKETARLLENTPTSDESEGVEECQIEPEPDTMGISSEVLP